MNPHMNFTAIYTERPGPEMIANILVIFSRRDELSDRDIDGTRQNLEAEGLIVYTKDAATLAEFTETILTPKPPSILEANGRNAQLEASDPFGSEQAVENHFTQPREEREFVGDEVMSRPHTKREATEAMKVLRGFIGHSQMACLADSCRSEEKQFFFDKLCEYADRVATMPQTYDQDGKGDEAIAYLHYFAGGACNWYITEKDKGGPDDPRPETPDASPPQHQATGWADLGDPMNAEFGYISIVEILAAGGELDLYFTPKTLKECKKC
jgi:hypothetical protein